MPRKKYYPFLDIVIDVLYSITLYNLFVNFPGFGVIPPLIIFVFITVLMINYWWFSRSVLDMPRHYLFDVYFYVIIMFIFTKLTEYMTEQSVHLFFGWLTILFIMDLIYSIADVLLQKYNNTWKKHLEMYMIWNLILSIYYAVCFFVINELTMLAVIITIFPYAIYIIIYIRKGLVKMRLQYEG